MCFGGGVSCLAADRWDSRSGEVSLYGDAVCRSGQVVSIAPDTKRITNWQPFVPGIYVSHGIEARDTLGSRTVCFVCVCVCVSVCLSVCVSICLFVGRSVCVFI